MRLVFALCFCFQGVWRAFSSSHCVYQLEALRVTEGESVTIPCTYSYSHYPYEHVEYRYNWVESVDSYCNHNRTVNIANETFTHDKYQGRLSMVSSPDGRSKSITIHQLRRTDGPVICCHVIQFRKNYPPYTWQNTYGTSLLFTDTIWVDQMSATPAILGDNVTIPCYIHVPPRSEVTIQKVTWRNGTSCFSKNVAEINSRISLHTRVIYPLENLATHISERIDHVEKRDENYYCCIVKTSEGTFSRRLGTELAIKDNSSIPGFNVTQEEHVVVQDGNPATMNCSFHHREERKVLHYRVYWRVDSVQGHYVIHQYEEMIHPRYKGRAKLSGEANLHLSNVQREDNALYYCVVMLTFCDKPYIYKSSIEHGKGTRLTVTGSQSKQTLYIILTVRFLVFCIVIMGGILGYRNVREAVLYDR